MGIAERLFGKEGDKKVTPEKLARLSKLVDVGTVFLALVFGGMNPALANTLIQASVATYAGAEVVESEIKRRKNKRSTS